jgi:hypothetical protein
MLQIRSTLTSQVQDCVIAKAGNHALNHCRPAQDWRPIRDQVYHPVWSQTGQVHDEILAQLGADLEPFTHV